MEKSTILVDMDGVLADFELGFYEKWSKQHPDEICIAVEDRTEFYLHHEYSAHSKHLEDKVREVTYACDFFSELPPIAGCIEGMKQLVAYGHQVNICTAPLSGSPTCLQEKYNWVLKYLGPDFAAAMIIVQDKTLVRGNYLIDDRPEVRGIYEPEWTHLLFHAPYNVKVVERQRLNSWNEIVWLFCP